MNSSSQNRNDARLEQAAVVNVLLLLVHAHATSVAIFLRRDFGKEALAANSLVAMFILFVMATQDPVFMTYLGLFLAMQIYRRIETFRKAWRGEIWHSLYPGYPYIALKCRNVTDERKAVQVAEPSICVLVGLAFLPISELLGLYIMLAGVSLVLRNGVNDLLDRKRIQQMYDARCEHEWYSNQPRR